jgi:hypothetical protein
MFWTLEDDDISGSCHGQSNPLIRNARLEFTTEYNSTSICELWDLLSVVEEGKEEEEGVTENSTSTIDVDIENFFRPLFNSSVSESKSQTTERSPGDLLEMPPNRGSSPLSTPQELITPPSTPPPPSNPPTPDLRLQTTNVFPGPYIPPMTYPNMNMYFPYAVFYIFHNTINQNITIQNFIQPQINK